MTDPNRWAALDEELRQLQAEHQAEIEAFHAQIERLLTLLAWLYRQIEGPKPIADQENWPEVCILNWPDTRSFAFADPLLFDLARHQAAFDLRRTFDFIDAYLEFIQEDEDLRETIARLLTEERPPPGQGASPGYAGIRAITWALRDIIHEGNPWNLWVRQRDHGNPWSFYYTDHAFAVALADRLNEHPLLADLPNAITLDKIRSSLRAD